MAEIDGRTDVGRWIEMNTCCKLDLQNAMSQGLKDYFGSIERKWKMW